MAKTEFRGRIYDNVTQTIGATPLVRLPRFAAFELPTLPAALLKQRPDLAEAERALSAAAADEQQARANQWPQVSIGGTTPLVIKRMGWDPALATGPILTTLTDVCGFFLTLQLATTLRV